MTYLTTTAGFKQLWENSRGRNRSPSQEFIDRLDPVGVHLVAWTMDHNDVEIRAKWFVKLTGQNEPAKIFMDNSFEAFEKWTKEREPAKHEVATG